MRRVNLFTAELEHDDDDPPGYESDYLHVGPLVGASRIGATIYSLERGQSNCPRHYEYGAEEWLLVLVGTLTVRTPGGDVEVGAGDVMCFPEGPDGAPKLTNKGDEPVRLVMMSTKNSPAVRVCPDSDKIGVWPISGGWLRQADGAAREQRRLLGRRAVRLTPGSWSCARSTSSIVRCSVIARALCWPDSPRAAAALHAGLGLAQTSHGINSSLAFQRGLREH